MSERGMVWLVGAGPGAPDLITSRGLRCLRTADVVVHDRLIARELLVEAPARARRIDVGKAPGRHPWPQSRINALLVAEARRGRRVVRLKGGDPFVFGRGGEESEALAAAGVRHEVVPGVSSAIAAPAFAGIPVTHRRLVHAFSVVTGRASDGSLPDVEWGALARAGTLVVLMGLGALPEIARRLSADGLGEDTPLAVIARAGTAEQRVVRTRLGAIGELPPALDGPATIVIGEAARADHALACFDAAGAPVVFGAEEAAGDSADRVA